MKKYILLLTLTCISVINAAHKGSNQNRQHKIPTLVASIKSEQFHSNNKGICFNPVRGPLSCNNAIFVQYMMALAIRDRTNAGRWLNTPQR